MTKGGRASYLITLQEVTGSIFTMTAVSVVDFDGDGQLVDETGTIKEIIED